MLIHPVDPFSMCTMTGVSGPPYFNALSIRLRSGSAACLQYQPVTGLHFPDALPGNGNEVDRFGWQLMLARLNPRQRHKVFDQCLHAIGFFGDNVQKAEPRCLILPCLRVFEGFNIAKNGRKGGAQFMAGIGDKIRMRARNALLH
jgi:hypothetical protein